MATTIKLKNSVTTTAAPSSLVQGEVATNITDKKVWVGDASSTPVQILGAGAPVSGTTGTFTGNTTVAGTFAANGGATLGDASGDALTINSSAVSIPNGLNFDSNTLVIDATNNRVGVGTASPNYNMTVNGGASATAIQLVNTSSGTTSGDGLIIYQDGVNCRFQNTEAGNISLFTSNTERAVLNSDGNLGLGVTPSAWGSPLGSAFLEAKNGMHFGSISTSSSIGYIGINSYYNGTNWIYKNSSAYANRYELNSGNTGSHAWFTAASGTAGNNITFTQAMTLNASGNLGVGTSSPTTRLQVDTANGTATTITLNQSGVGAGNISVPAATNALAFGVFDGVSAVTERMRINTSGNVGIGTSSPASTNRLTINGVGTAGNPSSTVTFRQGETDVFYVGPVARDNNTDIQLWNPRAGFLQFATNNTERMRLDSSGNLGLGVTPSAWGAGQVPAFDLGSGGLGFYSAGMQQNAYYNGTNWIYKTTNPAAQYLQSGGQHRWWIAPSGTAGNAITFTQAMTLDASGRLFLGTTTGVGNEQFNVTWNSSGTITQAINTVDSNASASNNYHIVLRKSDATYLGGFGRSSTNNAMFIDGNSYLDFRTGGTERMRIDSSGNLLVGTTSTGSITNGVTVTNPTTATILTIGHVTGTGSGSDYTIFRYNGTNIGSIVQNGTTQVTYATSSDYRLKDNISPMTGALAKVAQLKPCTYTWKSDGSDGQGFIAHELQAIVPECVTGEKDAVDAEGNPKYQGIDTSFLVATLTAAIQELKAEVDSLKAQLNK